MATNWVVPNTSDVRAVLADPAVDRANAIGATDSLTRLDSLLLMTIARVRGVIDSSSRNPLSATASSVPPEAQFHVAVLTARALVNSIPTMASALEPGNEFSNYTQKAEDWLKDVRNGLRVTLPTDPLTPALSGPTWGSDTFIDLTTDGT
jgi:hypothetical protein